MSLTKLGCTRGQQQAGLPDKFSQHPWWNQLQGWKHRLNNLQLVIQPYVYFCLIKPWLKVFEIPPLKTGFGRLIAIMNEFQGLDTDQRATGKFVIFLCLD